jgi:uncharacterized protein YodC (DUF2158 family)
MATFKIGDVVQLKSGGECMTVTNITPNGDVIVQWFGKGHIFDGPGVRHHAFQYSPDALMLASSAAPLTLKARQKEKMLTKPSDFKGELFGTVWNNREKEIVAGNILLYAQKHGDSWFTSHFTWDDYTSFCNHQVSNDEKTILDDFVKDGYLVKDNSTNTYWFTVKIVAVFILTLKAK